MGKTQNPPAIEADEIHNRIIKSTGSLRYWHLTTTYAIAQKLLLKGSFFHNGTHKQYKAQRMGCGVYKITIEEA